MTKLAGRLCGKYHIATCSKAVKMREITSCTNNYLSDTIAKVSSLTCSQKLRPSAQFLIYYTY